MKLILFIAGATVGFCATMGAIGSPSPEVRGRAAMIGTGTAIARVVTAGIAATMQRSGCGMFDSCSVDTSNVQIRN